MSCSQHISATQFMHPSPVHACRLLKYASLGSQVVAFAYFVGTTLAAKMIKALMSLVHHRAAS